MNIRWHGINTVASYIDNYHKRTKCWDNTNVCAKLYIKNLVTTPKSMTNDSRENSMLRFQTFALRLQIQI